MTATGSIRSEGLFVSLAFIAFAGGKLWWDEGKKKQATLAFASSSLMLIMALYMM